MGATNRTQNYNLPQFVGSDKPTWLGDFNGAMSSIDTQMKANNDLGSQANTKADTALNNAETAQTTASGAQTTAQGAQTTANSGLAKALEVEQALNAFKQVLNFNDISMYSGDVMSSTDSTILASSAIQIATNSDKSLFKCYGNIFVTTSTAGTHKLVIPNTGLNPLEEYSVVNACIEYYGAPGSEVIGNSITIKTNGDIEIQFFTRGAVSNMRLVLLPVLIFNKSFGDTPVNP